MEFLRLAQNRYSCRKFSGRQVEQDKIDAILQAAVAAPTAVNYQPYKLWILRSADALAKLSECTRYFFNAPLYIAVGADTAAAWTRKYDGKNFAEVDAAIVATHLMLAVQDAGLGTTWIGHFDPAKVKAAFPQMQAYELIALFPVGYAADDAVPSAMHTHRKSVAEAAEEL